jgi:ABC-type spermidine/putrescine transport system permease subunit I
MEAQKSVRRGLIFPPYLLLLFPAVTFMLLMYAYPFITSFTRSLIDPEGNISFANYAKTWDLYLKDIVFTFAVTIFSTAVTGALAVLLAVYLRFRRGPISTILSGLYKIPIFIPFVVVAQMMNSFLAPHGLLNIALAKLGLINIDQPLQLFNFSGLSFGFIWKMVPFSVLIIHGGFQMIDDSYIEAARSAGARLFKVITSILIPMSALYVDRGKKPNDHHRGHCAPGQLFSRLRCRQQSRRFFLLPGFLHRHLLP